MSARPIIYGTAGNRDEVDDSELGWHLNAQDRHHLIEVYAYTVAVPGSEKLGWMMTVKDARSLRDHLTQAIDGAQSARLDDARRGECATCGNRRMVDVPKHNTTSLEHCPDCSPAPIPTMSAWVDNETKVGER